MLRKIHLAFVCTLSLAFATSLVTFGQPPAAPAKRKTEKKTEKKEDQQKRDQSLRQLAKHLGIGPGAVVADVGAGNGPFTWVFADIVTGTGKVLSEEIEESKTKSIANEAAKRKLPQVTAVLGTTADPKLPAESVDLAFMHIVYHHVTQPHEMLQALWRSLKPGGKLVIIDQRLGTLTDWVPRADRGPKHHWIAETTVVREARERGFVFVECAEQLWHEKQAFVLVFQRPVGLAAPDRDPDAIGPIADGTLEKLLPDAGTSFHHVAFVALGEGRKLIGPVMKATGAAGVDVVLEEWATQKDERPPLDAELKLTSRLTDKGDPHIDPTTLDAVYFLDTYHLLFHGPTLLAKLHERLGENGRVYVLDRKALGDISRREASHRRMIAPDTVTKEMSQAGLSLVRECPLPGNERFLLVFAPKEQASE